MVAGTSQNGWRNNNSARMTSMKTLLPLLITACLGLGAATTAHAVDNPWIVHVGAHVGKPKSNNGQVAGMRVDVDSATRPTVSIEYLFTPNWSVDLLASAPFKHGIRLDGQKLATTKQLPPTVGVKVGRANVDPMVYGFSFGYLY